MKIGRNDPCHCGSGKKYKKCCLDKDKAIGPLPQVQSQAPEEDIETLGWEDTVEDESDSLPATILGEATMEREDRTPLGVLNSQSDLKLDSGSMNQEEKSRDSRCLFPRPKFELPELSPEQKNIVKQWWKEMGPAYKKNEVDTMLPRIREFLEQQPDLFPHLYLHEELLFELGAELGRRGRTAEYIELLLRLRREQPQMYVECFGYYDSDIIEHLTITGRRAEIPAYFNFFKQYADVDPDNCHKLMNWLAWVNYEEELADLAQAVAVPMIESLNVIGGNFAVHWLLLRAYFLILETHEVSEATAEQVRQAQQSAIRQQGRPAEINEILTVLNEVNSLPQGWLKDKARQGGERLLRKLHWNFAGYLRWHKGLGWLSACFLADQLAEYFFRDRKPQSPLDLAEDHLEPFMCRHFQMFFHLDGTRLLAFLQAVFHYADYLAYHEVIPPPAIDKIQCDCRSLYDKFSKAQGKDDSALRLYPTFEALCSAPKTESP